MADYKDPENTIVMETSKGQIVIELKPEVAPNHVARIKELSREGFYDNIVFHRVIDGFMAQCGCPQGRGTGGSDKPDLRFGMEFCELNEWTQGKGFAVFDAAELVVGINANGCAGYSRKELDGLTDFVKNLVDTYVPHATIVSAS